MFTAVNTYHSVNTRAATNQDLVIPRMNHCIGQQNICYFGVKIWLKIDSELKEIGTLEGFEEAIKKT